MADPMIERRATNWLRILDRPDLSGLVPICQERDPAAQSVHVGIRSRGIAVEELNIGGEPWVCARISDGPVWTPPPSVEERRREAYEARGATIEALVVAMWEKLIEGRPEAADAIQAARAEVKAEVPKSGGAKS